METDLLSLFSLLSTSLARAIDREKDPARSENQFDLAASNERITDVRFLKLPPRFKSPRRYAPCKSKTKLRRGAAQRLVVSDFIPNLERS